MFEHVARTNPVDPEGDPGASSELAPSPITFLDDGPLPPVAVGTGQPPAPTASELAFDGAHGDTFASAHVTSPKRVADRGAKQDKKQEDVQPNAVIKAVVFGEGARLQTWRSKARWEGPLPRTFTATRTRSGWVWDDHDGKSVKVNTNERGQGGQSVESWATSGDKVVVYAQAIGDVTIDEDAEESGLPPGHAKHDEDAGDGSTDRHRSDDRGGEHEAGADLEPTASDEQLADDLERDLGLDPDLDDDVEDETGATPGGVAPHGQGDVGGDRDGRTGHDTRVGGAGPGGEHARLGGDGLGSEDRGGSMDGAAHGSRDGQEGGGPEGMYGGKGKPGDAGVPSGGGLFGGLIGIPAALRGAVELALIVADGNIAGAGSGLFKQGLGKITTVVAARKMIASQARVTAARETKAALKQLATNPRTAAAWRAASKEEKAAVTRRMHWDMQRRYFDAYLAAARHAKRESATALKRSAKDAAARQRLAAAEMAEEAATVKPVAGRLPQNHQLAGKQFPADRLPARYRAKGVTFTPEGYPDFAPHAKQLPNGKTSVQIEYTGSRRADEIAANKKAGLSRDLAGYTWHHAEDGKTMYLVPTELHEAVNHTGGVAMYRHTSGIGRYGD